MEPQSFFEKLRQNPNPVVVDLWAPWCGPCKMVKPTLEKLAQEYVGRVDLLEINADENQDLLSQLKVYGIPTLIGYNNGEEMVRYVGAKPKNELNALFAALSNGSIPVSNGPSSWDRLIRLLAGSVVVGAAWVNQFHWSVLVIGSILMFSAVYDRCPIWNAIATQFKKLAVK